MTPPSHEERMADSDLLAQSGSEIPFLLLAQLPSIPGRPDLNGARAADEIRSNPAVDLAVFPELFLTGYAAALSADPAVDTGAALDLVKAACADCETAAIVGSIGSTPSGQTSAAICIDSDGNHVATCHKRVPFSGERGIVGHPESEVVPLAGQKVGVMICFDMEFPEVAREIARRGADLFVTISANPEPYFRNHRLHGRARALENLIPHAYVNFPGAGATGNFAGGTRLIDAHGEVRAELGADDEGTISERVPEPLIEYPDHFVYLEKLPQLARTNAEGLARW